jgi:hypothetical protein
LFSAEIRKAETKLPGMMMKVAAALLLLGASCLLGDASAQLAPWEDTEACYKDAGWE